MKCRLTRRRMHSAVAVAVVEADVGVEGEVEAKGEPAEVMGRMEEMATSREAHSDRRNQSSLCPWSKFATPRPHHRRHTHRHLYTLHNCPRISPKCALLGVREASVAQVAGEEGPGHRRGQSRNHCPN